MSSSLFELIEFSLVRSIAGEPRKGIYGVNVAKVREVVRMPAINPLSSKVRGIAGIFELRGIPIPAINLAVALGDYPTPVGDGEQIIVTEFSKRRAGFIVHQTHRIRRLAWDKIMPPAADSETYINGMTLIENNEFLFILDLERILLSLEGLSSGRAPALVTPPSLNTETKASAAPATGPVVLLVDDSSLILNSTKVALSRVGYRVVTAMDGQAALALLEKHNVSGQGLRIDIIVTDVEMPRMDGLTLISKVRAHPLLAGLPAILHTSLSGDSTQQSGVRVGANGYVVKNDLSYLCEMLKEVLGGQRLTA